MHDFPWIKKDSRLSSKIELCIICRTLWFISLVGYQDKIIVLKIAGNTRYAAMEYSLQLWTNIDQKHFWLRKFSPIKWQLKTLFVMVFGCLFDDSSEIILLIFHKNLCCGCSLELPPRGDSNEHPQHRFL